MNIFTVIDYPREIYKQVYETIDELNLSIKQPSLSGFSIENKLKFEKLYKDGGIESAFKKEIVDTSKAYYYAENNLYAEFIEEYFYNLKEIDGLYFYFLKSISEIYRIDEVTIFTNTVNHNVGSDFWHRDSVGHRLKLFIPILLKGNPPNTEFFRGSHVLTCRPFKWELERIGKTNPNTHLHQETIHNYYQNIYGCSQIFSWEYNKVLLLDTNTVHRAANFHSGTEGSFRIFMMIEFMEKTASKLASKMSLGQCNTLSNQNLINVVLNSLNK